MALGLGMPVSIKDIGFMSCAAPASNQPQQITQGSTPCSMEVTAS